MILWNCRQTFVGAACWYQQGWACTDVSLACTSHSQKKILSNSNRCCIISSFHRHISQIQSGGGTDYGVTGQLTRGDVTMTGDRDIKMRSHDSILDSWRHDCHRVLMTSHVSKIRGEIKILHSTHYQHPTLGSRHFLRPASCYLRGRKSRVERCETIWRSPHRRLVTRQDTQGTTRVGVMSPVPRHRFGMKCHKRWSDWKPKKETTSV